MHAKEKASKDDEKRVVRKEVLNKNVCEDVDVNEELVVEEFVLNMFKMSKQMIEMPMPMSMKRSKASILMTSLCSRSAVMSNAIQNLRCRSRCEMGMYTPSGENACRCPRRPC